MVLDVFGDLDGNGAIGALIGKRNASGSGMESLRSQP
jgi:hypothetical protein